MTELHQFCHEGWEQIPAKYYEKLAEAYPKHLIHIQAIKRRCRKY